MLESLNQEVVSVPVGWGRDLFMSVCVGGEGLKTSTWTFLENIALSNLKNGKY